MLKDETLLGFLNEVASTTPAPGGGSSSAAGGALACSLIQMVCNLTIGKKKYAEQEDKVKGILSSITELRERFVSLIDEDANAFNDYFQYLKLKELTPEQEADRMTAEKRCINVPQTTMETALSALSLAKELAPICNKNAISDLGCAIHFLRSSFYGAELNVRINLAGKENAEIQGYLSWLSERKNQFEDAFASAIDPVQVELAM